MKANGHILFGDPVYHACITALCMAFHARLGATSTFSCLVLLDQVAYIVTVFTFKLVVYSCAETDTRVNERHRIF